MCSQLPPQPAHLTSSSELPTYTVAGQQPHDAAPEALYGSVPDPRQKNAKKKLEAALDATSGPAPTGLIIRNPDGTPFRGFWLDANENLMHRPFNGAFPALSRLNNRPTVYRKNCIIRQLDHVKSIHNRAYTILLIAEAACIRSTITHEGVYTKNWRAPDWTGTRCRQE